MSKVMEICQLVIPLRDDSKRVFEKGDDDEEATDSG